MSEAVERNEALLRGLAARLRRTARTCSEAQAHLQHQEADALDRILTNPGEGEPVAWRWPTHQGKWVYVETDPSGYTALGVPLYTRPVAWPDREAVARAINDLTIETLYVIGKGEGTDQREASIRAAQKQAADAILALSASDGAGQEGEGWDGLPGTFTHDHRRQGNPDPCRVWRRSPINRTGRALHGLWRSIITGGWE